MLILYKINNYGKDKERLNKLIAQAKQEFKEEKYQKFKSLLVI